MARGNGRSAETTAALRRDEGFYIPLLPFPDSRILLLKNPAFVPQPASQNPPVLLPRKSVCRHTLPHRRVHRQPLFRVSRKQRYNTLDFPTENRVPTGMLAPLLETQRQRDAPFEIPHFPRRCIYNCKKQLVMPAQKMQKEAVLSHDTRVVELLPFIELQHRTGSAKPVQCLH